MTIITPIRERRRRLDLSARELARRVGVHPTTISKIELGQRTPRPLTMRRLARELGSTVDALFFAETVANLDTEAA